MRVAPPIVLEDFMPVQAQGDPETTNSRIIRLARCVTGRVDIGFDCRLGSGFKRTASRLQVLTTGIIEVKAQE